MPGTEPAPPVPPGIWGSRPSLDPPPNYPPGDPGLSPGGLLRCSHLGGPSPQGSVSRGLPRIARLGAPASPDRGRGSSRARGRRWVDPSARGKGSLPARRCEPPALTLSQQAPSSTNSRQNSYSRETCLLLPGPSARVRGPGRQTRGRGRERVGRRAAPSSRVLPSDTTAAAAGVGTCPRLARTPAAACPPLRQTRIARTK